jgi:hypothetical protein
MSVSRWMFLAAVSLPLSISLATAGPHVDPDKLPLVDCSTLHWNPQFLAKYPKAPAACQEARVYKGKNYAKFNAKVYLVDPDAVTLTFLNVAGDDLSTFTAKPTPGTVLYVNGKATAWKDLKVGDKLTLWVSENRFSVSGAPGEMGSPGTSPK